MFSLNFGVMTLVPKVQTANGIQQHRPIYLLNISLKYFTKVATAPISSVVDHIVSPTPTTFLRGQIILEGVLILHETVYELQHGGVIFKIDFENLMIKQEGRSLRMKGFSSKCIS